MERSPNGRLDAVFFSCEARRGRSSRCACFTRWRRLSRWKVTGRRHSSNSKTMCSTASSHAKRFSKRRPRSTRRPRVRLAQRTQSGDAAVGRRAPIEGDGEPRTLADERHDDPSA